MNPAPNPYAPPAKTPIASDRDGQLVRAWREDGRLSSRALFSLGLLVVATMLARTTHQGASMLVNLAPVDASLSALRVWLEPVGILVGGAAAAWVGPHVALAVGAAVAAAGCFGQTALPLPVFVALIELGTGMMTPCPVAAAAEVLTREDNRASPQAPYRFTAVAAFVIAANMVSSVAVFVPLILRQTIALPTYTRVVYLAGGILMIVVAALAVSSRLPGRAAEEGGVKAPKKLPPKAGALKGLAMVFALQLGYLLGGLAVAAVETLRDIGSSSGFERMLAVSVSSSIVASLAMMVTFMIGVRRRWSLPPLSFFGAGLAVTALGLVLIDQARGSLALGAASVFMMILVSVAVGSVGLAYAALAVRGRAATLIVGGWIVAETAMSAVRETLHEELGRTTLAWICAVLCAGGGAALLRFARSWHQRYFEAAGESNKRRRRSVKASQQAASRSRE